MRKIFPRTDTPKEGLAVFFGEGRTICVPITFRQSTIRHYCDSKRDREMKYEDERVLLTQADTDRKSLTYHAYRIASEGKDGEGAFYELASITDPRVKIRVGEIAKLQDITHYPLIF